MAEATDETGSPAAGRAADDEPTTRGKTVHGEAANAGHRVLAPDDAEVEAYLETALNAPAAERSPADRPTGPRRRPRDRSSSSTSAASSPSSSRGASASSTSTPSCCRTTRRTTSWSGAATRAIILSGGPKSVYDDDAPRPDPAIWSGRIPVLGICYGAQLMAHELGGDVLPADRREYGPASVTITDDDGLFTGIDREQPVWMSHGDSITRLPDGLPRDRPDRLDAVRRPGRPRSATCTASSSTPRSSTRRAAGTSCATSWSDIAGVAPTWTAANFIDTTVAGIRERVDAHAAETGSDGLVICALSGGVDSAVAAALVHRAVGDRLTCIYVDHGLMRKKESELLRVTFERDLGMRLVMVDARERFLARLAGVEDPEQKRKIIGDEFIRVFEEEAGQARPDRLPDPGHALPGRHRVGDVGDEGRPEDQDPPQRRRAAGRPALPAHRAAALPVQGRGPQGRAGAGPARGDGPAPAVPRARASRSGSSARSPPSGSTRCARPTGSSSTRSRRPACTGACGRASRS